MANEVRRNETAAAAKQQEKKHGALAHAFGVLGTMLLVLVLLIVTINAMLTMFVDDYYTTFGEYRLFAIVSDSMEPAIPKGSMILSTKPIDPDDIKPSTTEAAQDGTVITFKAKSVNGETILLTHRVVAVTKSSAGSYTFTTRGDNAGGVDAVHPKWSDVVGIYTGRKCGFVGSLFGFFQSQLGVSVLIFSMFIIVVAWVTIWYINVTEARKKLTSAALKKSAEALSTVNLRYDNIHEITAVMDILGMVSEEPKNGAESKMVAERLRDFINAATIELPQTPETAAILDSLPAPDTPGALAAALAAGATLRQAEDGQTLILTTLSGDKHILLTPINTPDGIILCRQGMRIRTDVAPNIEAIGSSSIPTVPEFFEGQPLEKNVVYPELPQPGVTLGPEMLLNGIAAQNFAKQLPEVRELPVAYSKPATSQALPQTAAAHALPGANAEPEYRPESDVDAVKPEQKDWQGVAKTDRHSERETHSKPSDIARLAYAQYRGLSAQLELKQTEQLYGLLSEATPLTADELSRVAEYRAAHAKVKKPRAPLTAEQKAARKTAAERRRVAKEAFLAALTAEDRELYLIEDKLSQTRQATIRKLKRIAADRKLLDSLSKKK